MIDPDDAAPLPALSTLMVRAMEILGKHGLAAQHFSVMPNIDPDGPHHAHVIHVIDPDWSAEAAEDEDPEFQAIIDGAAKAEQEQQAEKARESLSDLRDKLRDPGQGFL